MAITKLMHMKTAKSGNKSSHLKNAIDYILKKEKVVVVNGISLSGTNACLLSDAYNNMMDTKRAYGKTEGRQGYHFVISFKPEQATAEQVYKITQEFVQEYLNEYECVYAIHDDQPHKHGHIVFNSVSYQTGLKYHYANGDWERKIQPIIDRLCIEQGLPPLEYHIDLYENEKDTKEYYHYTKGFNWKKEIKNDIDECINNSQSWEDFITNMKETGYHFNFGKSVSIRKPGMGNARRLKETTMGMEYTPEGIITRINIKTGAIRLSNAAPKITGTEKLPDDRHAKRKYKKYKDMSFEEKALLKHMLRIRNAIPEYKIYPGVWYRDRKINELHRVEQEFIVVKKFDIHGGQDIVDALKELVSREKSIRSARNQQELLKQEYKDLIESHEYLERHESGEDVTGTEKEYQEAEERISAAGETRESIRTFLRDCDKNDKTFQMELNNIKKQKAALMRLKKKEEREEKQDMTKISKQEKEVITNGRRNRPYQGGI